MRLDLDTRTVEWRCYGGYFAAVERNAKTAEVRVLSDAEMADFRRVDPTTVRLVNRDLASEPTLERRIIWWGEVASGLGSHLLLVCFGPA